MKMHKKAVNRLQNLALVLLTLSALTLLTQLPLFSEGWNSRMKALFSDTPVNSITDETGDLSSIMPSVHLVSTSNSEYGRHSQIGMDAASPALVNVLPLFRDALGSAVDGTSANDRSFRTALDSPGLFLSLTTPLPGNVIAFWLGSETAPDLDILSMALTTGDDDDSATLYLCDPNGAVHRYDTALSSTAIYDCVSAFSPNGGSFAFETGHSQLAPYTVLISQTPAYMDVYAGIPSGYSAYNLLTALDFNAHTNSRYFETGGTEVVQESPRTLRISPDGSVAYSGDKFVDSPLYHVSTTAEASSAKEALQASMHLASVLTGGTNASPLRLHSISATDTGWEIGFRYQVQGLPVLLPNNTLALTVTISDGVITSFTYYCRSFVSSETPSTLLPPSMAAAIAAQHPRSGLSICYIDNGEDLLSARWLAD